MKTTQTIRMVLAGLTGCLAMSAFAGGPEITAVQVRQRWPWSRLVDINYVLECGDTEPVNVTVTGYSGTTPINLTSASLSGDLYTVSSGVRRIVWDPAKSFYTNEIIPWFRVDLTPTEVPLYMILDLTKMAGATNQIEYVYEADLITNKWGSWERDFVQGVESVIWTGVTNGTAYKIDKLVLRRIPAGSFKMGAAGYNMTLTQDFYAGVFEVTEEQWATIMGGAISGNTKPKGAVSYNDIRGATNDVPPVNWHTTGSFVNPTNFIGLLRSKTGIDTFDLPTEAQWEYLCRAGTTTDFNNGESWSPDFTNTVNQLSWWKANSGNMTHKVGEKRPNAWGLYDTNGNVWEWCLDWYASTLVAATDPKGPASSTTSARLRRGGGSWDDAGWQRTHPRTSDGIPSARVSDRGFRLVRILP